MNIGNGTKQGKCKVCGKKTGDFFKINGKEFHCHFVCIHKLEELK